MSELYKLVFRGEVLDGQHPAVVRKRLAEAAGFDAAALDKLFSGRPVVLKRAADAATAARLQLLFKTAGARLRALPAPADQAAAGDQASSDPSRRAGDAAERAARAGEADQDLMLLPEGSEVLREDERSVWQPREVDTGALALEQPELATRPADPVPPAPDVSHLSLAETGVRLGAERPPATPLPAPDLELAAAGVDLAPRAVQPPAPVDFASLRFEVAPAGADLGQKPSPPPPAAPDTAHLSLREASAGEA